MKFFSRDPVYSNSESNNWDKYVVNEQHSCGPTCDYKLKNL